LRRNRILSRTHACLNPMCGTAILLIERRVYRSRSPVYRVEPLNHRDLAAYVKMLGHSPQRDGLGSINLINCNGPSDKLGPLAFVRVFPSQPSSFSNRAADLLGWIADSGKP